MTGIAVLGCGLVGTKRVQALPPGVDVVSAYDVDRARAEALARGLHQPVLVARSAEEAVAAAGVDLAVVAAFHRDLVPLGSVALDAGCHVLIEKPGGRSAAEVASLKDKATASGRVVRVGFNHRFHPAIIRAAALIGERADEPVLWLRGRYGHGGRLGYEKEWRGDPEISGGGELLDQGVHLIDLCRHLVGEVELAFAEVRTDFWTMAVEDNAYLALRPARGGMAWLHASWTEWKNTFSLEISLARTKIDIAGLGGSYGTERLTLYEMSDEMGPPATSAWEWPQPDTSWRREMTDVLDAIAGRPAAGADLDDAIATLRIVDRAYQR